jgi:hypothetical protein
MSGLENGRVDVNIVQIDANTIGFVVERMTVFSFWLALELTGSDGITAMSATPNGSYAGVLYDGSLRYNIIELAPFLPRGTVVLTVAVEGNGTLTISSDTGLNAPHANSSLTSVDVTIGTGQQQPVRPDHEIRGEICRYYNIAVYYSTVDIDAGSRGVSMEFVPPPNVSLWPAQWVHYGLRDGVPFFPLRGDALNYSSFEPVLVGLNGVSQVIWFDDSPLDRVRAERILVAQRLSDSVATTPEMFTCRSGNSSTLRIKWVFCERECCLPTCTNDYSTCRVSDCTCTPPATSTPPITSEPSPTVTAPTEITTQPSASAATTVPTEVSTAPTAPTEVGTTPTTPTTPRACHVCGSLSHASCSPPPPPLDVAAIRRSLDMPSEDKARDVGIPNSSILLPQIGIGGSTMHLTIPAELLAEANLNMSRVRLFRMDADGAITASAGLMRFSNTNRITVQYSDRSAQFILTEITLGDVTGTGKPEVTDALQILRSLVGLSNIIETNAIARAAALITNPDDSAPSVNDALQILRNLVGLSSRLDVPESANVQRTAVADESSAVNAAESAAEPAVLRCNTWICFYHNICACRDCTPPEGSWAVARGIEMCELWCNCPELCDICEIPFGKDYCWCDEGVNTPNAPDENCGNFCGSDNCCLGTDCPSFPACGHCNSKNCPGARFIMLCPDYACPQCLEKNCQGGVPEWDGFSCSQQNCLICEKFRCECFPDVSELVENVDFITIRGVRLCTSLTWLDMDAHFEQFTLTDADIAPLRFMTNLTGLSMSNHLLTDISPIAGLTGLTSLEIHSNRITCIAPVANLTELIDIWAAFNLITDPEPLLPLINLRDGSISGNMIDLNSARNINILETVRRTAWQNLGWDGFTYDAPAIVEGVENVDFIAIRGVRYCTSIPAIELWNMGLTSEELSPLRYLTNLVTAELVGNQITCIEFLSGLPLLNEVYLWNNLITDISMLGQMPRLNTLYVNNNYISDITPLLALPNLQELSIENNLFDPDDPEIAEIIEQIRGNMVGTLFFYRK